MSDGSGALTAASLSLSPPLLFPPVQSFHMICQFFTHGGWNFACAALCLLSTSGIGPPFAYQDPHVPLLCSTLRSSVFPFRAGKWRNGRSTTLLSRAGNNVKESRPLDRREDSWSRRRLSRLRVPTLRRCSAGYRSPAIRFQANLCWCRSRRPSVRCRLVTRPA